MVKVSHADRIRSWMFDIALPFWATHGVDRNYGGYVEQLSLDGKDLGVPFKRTRVACRQVYVYSHAYIMGWADGLQVAAPGVDYLISRAWQGEEKGFARRLTRAGDVLDPTTDLYDHAFVLFAFAWHHRATGDQRSYDWMHRTLDFIERQMRHPGGLGFWHEIPGRGWRLQNPHMHLTEASVACYQATGEQRFETLAHDLVELFRTHFFDKASGALGEYFDDNWKRATGDHGRITEPGHQMEWAWILNACRKTFGSDTGELIRKCAAFAETHGIDPKSHAVYNAVRDDGRPIDRGSRTWPNTERLKAAVALYELDGVDPTAVFDQTNSLLLDRYLGSSIPGGWLDAFDSDGKSIADNIPSSTFYHVFLAFAEVLRFATSSHDIAERLVRPYAPPNRGV